MGMTIGFTRVTPAELEHAFTADDKEAVDAFLDERSESGGETDGYLDKSWGGLQFLLDAAGLDIDLRNDGDFIGSEGVYFGWSADQVRHAAQQLRATPFESLAPHLDPVRMAERGIYPKSFWDDGRHHRGYLREHYQSLVTFFEGAASSGAAAIMTFNY